MHFGMEEKMIADRYKHPLVSIITPSYNAMPFIRENIESVLKQDYQPIEHIVIDGNSTDGTVQVLDEYPHLVWLTEPDRGQSDALNKGFALAKGDIIGWLNADDTYPDGAVAAAVDFLERHAEIDLVYGDIRIIDETGNPVGVSKSKPFDLAKLLFENFINQPSVFMRRRVIETLDGVNTDLQYVMDRELWLRAGMKFRMAYLESPALANFRLIPGTKSFQHTPAFHREWVDVLGKLDRAGGMPVVPRSVVRRAIRKTTAQYHLAKMIRAIGRRERVSVVAHCIRSCFFDPMLVFNRGLWKFIWMGVWGLPVDRLRKYRKGTL